jgi:hypothetical protein
MKTKSSHVHLSKKAILLSLCLCVCICLNAQNPYKITKGDLCYKLFIKHGFSWGGEWKSKKDYQHFEK